MTVDTLTLAREFRAAEFPTGQAEALASAIGRVSVESMDSVATKADLAGVEARLEGKIEAMQSKLLIWFMSSQIAVGALIVALIKL